MKKYFKIFSILISFLPAFAALAQYVPLETLPGLPGAPGGGDISSYFQWIFVFGISIAGILAVLMIVVGGIEYMTAYGNPSKVGDAKDRITQAILGLLLAITGWLILNTISPDLTKGVLNIPNFPYGSTGSY